MNDYAFPSFPHLKYVPIILKMPENQHNMWKAAMFFNYESNAAWMWIMSHISTKIPLVPIISPASYTIERNK